MWRGAAGFRHAAAPEWRLHCFFFFFPSSFRRSYVAGFTNRIGREEEEWKIQIIHQSERT